MLNKCRFAASTNAVQRHLSTSHASTQAHIIVAQARICSVRNGWSWHAPMWLVLLWYLKTPKHAWATRMHACMSCKQSSAHCPGQSPSMLRRRRALFLFFSLTTHAARHACFHHAGRRPGGGKLRFSDYQGMAVTHCYNYFVTLHYKQINYNYRSYLLSYRSSASERLSLTFRKSVLPFTCNM